MKNGKDTILLIQEIDAEYGDAAVVVANQTESTYAIENDVKDEQTKFGRVVGYGNNSESYEYAAYGERNDPGQMGIFRAIEERKHLKLWEIDVSLDAQNQHDAMFAYVIVESAERSNAQDGYEEISGTFQVYGKAQRGKIDKLPLAVIEFGQYGFEKPGEFKGEADTRVRDTSL